MVVRMRQWLLLAVVILVVGGLAQQLDEEVACKVVVSNKKQKKSWEYDLSTLRHDPELSDSLFFRDDLGNIIYVNPCGSSTTACSPPQTVCTRSPMYVLVGYGVVSTQRIHALNVTGAKPDKGVTMSYTGGYDCEGTTKRSAVVHVECQESVESYIHSSVISTTGGGCLITITIRSPAGCGREVDYVPGSDESGSGVGAGGIILILLCVGVVVYLVAGAGYNLKMRGATTLTEAIPQYEFWCAVPGLVKDGVLFIAHGFKRGDYASV
jgi:hypothetical protein